MSTQIQIRIPERPVPESVRLRRRPETHQPTPAFGVIKLDDRFEVRRTQFGTLQVGAMAFGAEQGALVVFRLLEILEPGLPAESFDDLRTVEVRH